MHVRTAVPLPHVASELLGLRLAERAFYRTVVAAHRAVGAWRRNAPRSGDLATMRWIDVAYWIHKTSRPIDLPERGGELDGLERLAPRALELPAGFVPEETLTLALAGDLMMHAFLGASEDLVYEDVADAMFAADLSLANLEAVFVPSARGAPPRDRELAPKLGFDAASLTAVTSHRGRTISFVSLANNHILDHGAASARSTARELVARGIAHHGLNLERADSERPALLEARGSRVAVSSWTFGLNARRPPADSPWLVNHLPLNDAALLAGAPLLRSQLAAARREADFVVVSLHWGMEFERYPRRAQQTNARDLAELGADLVVGHHPHVVQPMELYRTRRDPDRVVPIFYSLGNLTNPCSVPFMGESVIARVSLARGRGRDGASRTYVTGLDPHWVRQRADERQRIVTLHPIESKEVSCPS